MALQYIKQVDSFDCEVCETTRNLKEDRNCGWIQKGICPTCGPIPFEDLERKRKGSGFGCPTCGSKVRWKSNKSEFQLGEYRTPGCPKSMISPRAVFLIQLVDWSEETGVLPTGKTLFEESMLYFEIRNFVVSERAVSENQMQPKETK